MTSRSNPSPSGQEKAVEKVIATSHEAETEKNVVGEAKPVERTTASHVAALLALVADGDSMGVSADGNRLTATIPGPNGLIQTFHATVEEGIREF